MCAFTFTEELITYVMALFTAKVKEMSQTVRVKYLIHNKEI
jgi:hypothetical protein